MICLPVKKNRFVDKSYHIFEDVCSKEDFDGVIKATQIKLASLVALNIFLPPSCSYPDSCNNSSY